MRKLRNLIIWIIISIIVQTSVLYYFDKYHFKNAADVTYKVQKTPEKKDKAVSVSIPKDAKNITPSYTGKYAYYYSGNSIYVVNMATGKSNAIKLSDGIDIDNVCVDWCSTNDSLVMLELNKDDLSFKMYSYYPDDNRKDDNSDSNNDHKTYPLGKNAILSMKQNNVTTLIYIKSAYSKDSEKRYISNLDTTFGLKQMDLPIKNIGDYYIFKAESKLVYEDDVDKKVYISKQDKDREHIIENKSVKIDGVDKYKLISVYDKYAYIGKLVDDKIDTIYYASIASQNTENSTDDNSSNNKNSGIKSSNILQKRNKQDDTFTADWQQINLSGPVNPKDIYISANTGNMYTINNLKGVVENIKTKKKTQFQGAYIGMSDDDVFSFDSDNGKLIENILK